MARAIELARAHHPHPNPRVGAVLVGSGGNVIGEGAHVAPGHPHAEIVALGQAGDSASGSTLYTTLEPCTVHGRTPPCVEAILRAGVARVVIGATDPDSRVSGAGIQFLRAAGLDITEDVMHDAVRAMDPAYFHHRSTGMPLVTIKYAMTLDGAVAAADSTSQWITGPEARTDAHHLRADSDAVVIGAGTLRVDDPRLDVRLEGYEGHQPRPVVVVGRESVPTEARIWAFDPIVFATREIDIPNGTLVVVAGENDRPRPMAVCHRLAEMGVLQVLLEGGPTLAGEWWRAGVVNRGVAYIGAKVARGAGRSAFSGVFANIEDAEVVSVVGMRSLGGDIRIDFER